MPNDFARFLGSTVRSLEKEFKYLSPSSRPARAASAPVAAVKPAAPKPCFFKNLLSMPCAKPVKVAAPVIPAVAVEAPKASLPTVAPIIRHIDVVAPAAPVAPVAEVAAPARIVSQDNVLQGVQFASKSEQVRAEIYFRDLRSSSKVQRMEALGEIKKLSRPTMIAGLRQVLASEQDALQTIEILNALGAIGAETRLPKQLFTDYLSHGDTGVRLAALRAISKYNDEEAFGYLTSLIKDKNHEVRRQILNCLCWSFSERCLPFALKSLHDIDPGVRKSAAGIVGTLRSHMAISALISLLSDPSDEVQESASAALKKITKEDFDFKVSASKKAKDDAIEGWRYWWRDHQTSFGREKK